jgi:hypothetical protein
LSFFDWVALAFAFTIIGLAVVGELKDIELCTLAIERYGDALELKWRRALLLCQAVRRFTFLPVMLIATCSIIVIMGGDALTACFNSLAILFMTEIDNTAYLFGLGERARARVESMGRVELSKAEVEAMARTKLVHLVLVVAVCLVSVKGSGSSDVMMAFVFMFCPFAVLWAGAAAEALSEPSDSTDTTKRASTLAVKAMVGVLGFGLVLITNKLTGWKNEN